MEALPYNIIFTLIFHVEDAVPYNFDIQFNAYDIPTNCNLNIALRKHICYYICNRFQGEKMYEKNRQRGAVYQLG